jgi:hypothetical protein
MSNKSVAFDHKELENSYHYNVNAEAPKTKNQRITKNYIMAMVINGFSLLMVLDYTSTIITRNTESFPTAKRIDGFTLNKVHDPRSAILLKNVLQNSNLTVDEINQLNLDK